jgi:hypothetical protein
MRVSGIGRVMGMGTFMMLISTIMIHPMFLNIQNRCTCIGQYINIAFRRIMALLGHSRYF